MKNLSEGKKNYLRISAVVLFILSFAVLGTVSIVRPEYVTAQSQVSDSQALIFVNKERSNLGLEALKENELLDKAAKDKAEDMINSNYFEHTSPTGKKAWDFILAENYDYAKAGENLSIDYKKLADAQEAWMASPTHKTNILSDEYKEFGFGSANGSINGKETTVYVQLFGIKRSIYDRMLTNVIN